MSRLETLSACFYWTQEIWNQAWHSNDACSLSSITAKIACIVFPILLSVAIGEGIIWAAHFVFNVSKDPKILAVDSQLVEEILPKVHLEKELIFIEPYPVETLFIEPATSVQVEPMG